MVEVCVFSVTFFRARDLRSYTPFLLYLSPVTTMTRSAGVVGYVENLFRGPQFLANFLFIWTVLRLYYIYRCGLRGNETGEKSFPQELGGFRSRSGRVFCLTAPLGVWTCGLLESLRSVGTTMGSDARPLIFIGSDLSACSGRLWRLTDLSWTSIPEVSYGVGKTSSASSVDKIIMDCLAPLPLRWNLL